MMSSKNKGFTASDMERYHGGKMSPEERHALEKAALEDPFLADALEGYLLTSTASDDIAKIQSRLDEKLKRKKAVPFYQSYKWLRIAAMVLLIAGAGWYAYRASKPGKVSTVTALKKSEPAKDSDLLTTFPAGNLHDSSKDKTASQTNEPVTKKQANPLKSRTQGTLASHPTKGSDSSDLHAAQEKGNDKFVAQTISVPSLQNEVASANSRYQDNRGYLNMKNAAEPGLKNASTNLDRKGVLYQKADNNAPISGRINRMTNDTITNLTVVLKPLPQDTSLKEVVMGYSSQKRPTEKYPYLVIDTLEPEEGYVHFDNYVASNLRMPEEIKDKTAAGEVQLSFDVDENGQPTNITVVRSLCQKCDEEAIRLLKEGPKWNKKKNKKGKITIRF